jgi:hypothetical protein
MNSRFLPVLLLALVACSSTRPPPVPPRSEEPPDPRRGERLDGRSEPLDPARRPRAVGDVLLTVPRWLVEALAWPVVRLTLFVENHHLVSRAYWALTSEDQLVGLRPEARYETGLIASVGGRYFNRRTLGPGSLVEILARSGGPRFLYGQLRLRAPHERSLSAEWRTLFESNPDQLFGGTHGERLEDLRAQGRDLARYGFYRTLTDLTVEGAIAGILWAVIRAEVDLRTYRTTDSLDAFWCAVPGTVACTGVDDNLVPGFHDGLRLARVHGGLLLDTREGPRLGGVKLSLDGELARGVLNDPSLHAKIIADARLALRLSDSLLILRANAGLVRPLGDAPVPFEELLSPSGNDGLRGLAGSRLRGHSQLFGSIEYRWLVTPFLDTSVFVDQGGAFDRGFAGLSWARMIPSYGFGMRIHEIRGDYWNAETLFRFQFAHAAGEGSRIMIGLGTGD